LSRISRFSPSVVRRGSPLSVAHTKIQKRVEEHRKEAAKNSNKRGPKRKVKPSLS